MDEVIKAALAETTKLLEDLEWSSRCYYFGNRGCPVCEADAPERVLQVERHPRLGVWPQESFGQE